MLTPWHKNRGDSSTPADVPTGPTPSVSSSPEPGTEEEAAPTEFKVCFVCTGNVCRSPLAMGYLNDITGDIPVRAESGGTGANPEVEVPQEILDIASSRGFDLSAHRPRAITVDGINEADLVLTATTEQRSEVLSATPRALKKTFTLKEFARLAELVEWEPVDSFSSAENLVQKCSAFVAEASSRRSQVGRDAEADLDIVDPYLQDAAVYRQTGEEVFMAIDQFLRKMFR